MISVKKHITSVVVGTVVASSMVLGGQPMATALDVVEQSATSVSKEVKMPYPLGGEHRILIHAANTCWWPSGKGNEPVRQSVGAGAMDLDADPGGNFFSLHGFFPFNSLTIKWENKKTGATGSKTVRSNGNDINTGNIESGTGEVEAKVTVTRSLLPVVMEDFPLSSMWSASHTETFTIESIDEKKCEAGPG